ncbi:hypothetical protein [Streptomyces sp. NPDC050485]|uniref:hypothetical protein n=1 Tax=Streptomyces sp. NPDC050485 TaxID=3365617 RepID=UPI0037A0474A
MTEDVVAIRLRLAQIVAQAETDEAFRTRLANDPSSVLAEFQIPENAVEEFSQTVSVARAGGLGDEIEGECLHTSGCNDFTCIASRCGATCYVTIKIDAPDT